MPINFKRYVNRHTLVHCLFFICLFAFSLASVYAMGMRRGVLAHALTLLISLLLASRMASKWFVGYFFLLFLFTLFLLPNTISYGQLSFGMVVSIMETSLGESYEYLISLPRKSLLYTAGYVGLSLGIFLCLNQRRKARQYSKTSKQWLLLLFLFCTFFKPVSLSLNHRADSASKALSRSYYSPLTVIFSWQLLYATYQEEKQKLRAAKDTPSTWQVTAATPAYQNYVVVIGESARRDYQSLYGFPIQTTPFMDKVNATIFTHYVSPASITPASIKRMLVQNNKENFTYENSVVTLAKRANFKTYWLSNQGFVGHSDTDTSLIALNADEVFFVSEFDSLSNPKPDLQLLPKLATILQVPTKRPRVIFMHLMGSHSNFCRRLDAGYQIEAITDFVNRDLSCYLTTIRQTDALLSRVHTLLTDSKQSFSMMYFSDHGQVHRDKGRFYTTLKHDGSYRQGYDVPMIVMSSDDKTDG